MRRSQGAVEYLFMVALALLVVYLVLRTILGIVRTAQVSTNRTASRLERALENLSNIS